MVSVGARWVHGEWVLRCRGGCKGADAEAVPKASSSPGLELGGSFGGGKREMRGGTRGRHVFGHGVWRPPRPQTRANKGLARCWII